MFTGLGYWLPVFFATSLDGEFVSFSEDENVDNGFASFDREGRKCLPYLQSMMTGTRSEKTYRQLHESFSRVAAPRQG